VVNRARQRTFRGGWIGSQRPGVEEITAKGRALLETVIGTCAAALTSLASAPQVYKCWRTRSAGDLSLKTLIALMSGLTLWIIYGFLKGDGIIIAANAVALSLYATLLSFRLRFPAPPDAE
jgi:MtN3 and saliva related transmembrane protein